MSNVVFLLFDEVELQLTDFSCAFNTLSIIFPDTVGHHQNADLLQKPQHEGRIRRNFSQLVGER
jgi:hypothetical protein